MASRVNELTRGKIRNLPLSAQLRGILQRAAEQTDLRVVVTSGGQAPHPGRPRTGSTRHDVGGARLGAADLQLVHNGRLQNFTIGTEQRRMFEFVRLCVAAGCHGVGAGISYMGPSTIHVGGGTSATWGSATGGVRAPQWLIDAHAAGRRR